MLSVLQPDSATAAPSAADNRQGADDWASVQTLTPPKAAGSPRAIMQVVIPKRARNRKTRASTQNFKAVPA